MARICIICEKEKDGTPIKMDWVLRVIRRIKTALRISTGHELVVCESCLPESKKRREKFEKTALTMGGLGAVLGIVLLIANLLGGFNLSSFFSALALLVFLVVIFLLISLFQYHPALAAPTAPAAPAAPAAPTAAPQPAPAPLRPKRPRGPGKRLRRPRKR